MRYSGQQQIMGGAVGTGPGPFGTAPEDLPDEKLVPLEPTPEMLVAVWELGFSHIYPAVVKRIYLAMVLAAPDIKDHPHHYVEVSDEEIAELEKRIALDEAVEAAEHGKGTQ